LHPTSGWMILSPSTQSFLCRFVHAILQPTIYFLVMTNAIGTIRRLCRCLGPFTFVGVPFPVYLRVPLCLWFSHIFFLFPLSLSLSLSVSQSLRMSVPGFPSPQHSLPSQFLSCSLSLARPLSISLSLSRSPSLPLSIPRTHPVALSLQLSHARTQHTYSSPLSPHLYGALCFLSFSLSPLSRSLLSLAPASHFFVSKTRAHPCMWSVCAQLAGHLCSKAVRDLLVCIPNILLECYAFRRM